MVSGAEASGAALELVGFLECGLRRRGEAVAFCEMSAGLGSRVCFFFLLRLLGWDGVMAGERDGLLGLT